MGRDLNRESVVVTMVSQRLLDRKVSGKGDNAIASYIVQSFLGGDRQWLADVVSTVHSMLVVVETLQQSKQCIGRV